MIFVAVGTQFPFDRMVRAVDDWAKQRGVTDVVAQVGKSKFLPSAIKTHEFLSPDKFADLQENATLLIGHAGMGTILGALQLGKPLIIMPRIASYGEHRNDHQLSTLNHFGGKPGIYAAQNEAELRNLLDRRDDLVASQSSISEHACARLIGAIQSFILCHPCSA